MAQLPPRYLHSVVAVGTRSSPEQFAETGEPMVPRATAFLYAYPRSGSFGDQASGFRLWLVTCAHVVVGLANRGAEEMLVRMNRSASPEMQTFIISLLPGAGPHWTTHPSADAAAIPASWQDLESKDILWETFAAGHNTLSKERSANAGLSEGDEVFMAGFPRGWRRGRQDYPIVRHGVLAQVQGWLNGEHETFLVDGSGFPGNSGGPVVTKSQMNSVTGTKTVPGSWLVGMVSRRRFSPIPKRTDDSTKPHALVETADLIEVVPMDAIDEVVKLAMEKEG